MIIKLDCYYRAKYYLLNDLMNSPKRFTCLEDLYEMESDAIFLRRDTEVRLSKFYDCYTFIHFLLQTKQALKNKEVPFLESDINREILSGDCGEVISQIRHGEDELVSFNKYQNEVLLFLIEKKSRKIKLKLEYKQKSLLSEIVKVLDLYFDLVKLVATHRNEHNHILLKAYEINKSL